MLENAVVRDLLANRSVIYRCLSPQRADLTVDHLLNAPAFNILSVPEGRSGLLGYKHLLQPDKSELVAPYDSYVVADSEVTFHGITSVVAVNTVRADAPNNPCVGLSFLAFMRLDKSWDIVGSGCLVVAPDTPGKLALASGYSPHGEAFLDELTAIVVQRLSYVNSAASAVRVLHPTGRHGNVHKALKSKKPLWEYREVEINSERPAPSQSKGGTHASPRWHTRRGHWRNYKSGKRVWVDQMEVGDKTLGVVVKDYTFSKGEVNAKE